MWSRWFSTGSPNRRDRDEGPGEATRRCRSDTRTGQRFRTWESRCRRLASGSGRGWRRPWDATHHGGYDALVKTTGALLQEAEDAGIVWDSIGRSGVTEWAARVEYYRVGPGDDPSPRNWRTDIEILTRGAG